MEIKKKHKIISLIYIILILLLVYLPIFSMIFFSFNKDRSVTRFTGLSLKWYGEIFKDKAFLKAMINTITIALISTIFSIVVGTFGAISLNELSNKKRKLILGINNVPMISPEIITAISLFVIFGTLYIPPGYISIVLAHITFSTPYVIVTIYPKLLQLDKDLKDAAADLGATPIKIIFKVILPQIKGTIISAMAIAFAMSFDDFVISYFVAGDSGIQNISIYLYTLKRDVKPTINAFSAIIMLIVIAKIIFDFFTWPRKIKKEKKRGNINA